MSGKRSKKQDPTYEELLWVKQNVTSKQMEWVAKKLIAEQQLELVRQELEVTRRELKLKTFQITLIDFIRRSDGHVQNTALMNCEFILSLILKKDEQEGAIGDFLERYAQKVRRLGKRRANLWAYSDVARTVWPLLLRKLMRIAGIVGAVEWIKRHLS